jgi:molybdate transport system substrate-binding protein
MPTALLLFLLLLFALPARAETLVVLAAASLTDALKEISAAWVAQGHAPPRLSFAASSALARQVENGAVGNLFASADGRWMDYLAARGLIVPGTRRDLLSNRLVLVVPADRRRSLTIGPDLDLAALLGADGRLAIADPAAVPAGLYAAQALRQLGLWDRLAPRLARAENVRAALLLVERGEAPAGIVYATDAATAPHVAVAGIFPAALHAPITYPFAILRDGDTAEARALMEYLTGKQAREIFVRHGFLPE